MLDIVQGDEKDMVPTPQRAYRLERETDHIVLTGLQDAYRVQVHSLYKPNAREALVNVVVQAWEGEEGSIQENLPYGVNAYISTDE